MLIFLTAQLERLLNQARRAANDLINKEDPHHTENLDIASFYEGKNRWIRIHNRESNLIKQIQKTLWRIEEGEFSIYEDFGKEITIFVFQLFILKQLDKMDIDTYFY